jgi:hypothetical protein
MRCPTSATNTIDMPSIGLSSLGQFPDNDHWRPLRCVWTNHPSHDRCCQERIPTAVVLAAWRGELERGRVRGDRFFHFAWRGRVWVAYGLLDGDVRGVYCPGHSAARDARSSAPGEVYPIALTA